MNSSAAERHSNVFTWFVPIVFRSVFFSFSFCCCFHFLIISSCVHTEGTWVLKVKAGSNFSCQQTVNVFVCILCGIYRMGFIGIKLMKKYSMVLAFANELILW